jgi:protein-tyrosine phosphatase
MTVVTTDEEMQARRLPLKGTYNVRDIGGYVTTDGRSVTWGRVLRGDAMHLVDDDGRVLLAEYGLQTSVDLRNDTERAESPDRLNTGVRLVSIPLLARKVLPDGAAKELKPFDSLDEVFEFIVVDRAAEIVAVLRELASADALPALVHCTGGKDRTGVVIGVLLASLGVPDDVIAADFAATAQFLGEEFREIQIKKAVDAGGDRESFSRMLGCDPHLILDALERIRSTHGDVATYLVDHGLDPEELERIRSLLLDAAPDAAVLEESADPPRNEGAPHV